MINKPSRKTSIKLYGVVKYSLIIFSLIIMPIIALTPNEIRMKLLHRGYKLIGGEER